MANRRTQDRRELSCWRAFDGSARLLLGHDGVIIEQCDLAQKLIEADFGLSFHGRRLFHRDSLLSEHYLREQIGSGGAGGNSQGISETVRTGHGLGDVSAGASYRVLQESLTRPDLVVSARVKAPTGRHPFGVELVEIPGSQGNLSVPSQLSTGSGVWGSSISISALKTIDPMEVYGSASSFYNFARHFSDIDEAIGDQPGRARLGSAFQFGAGVAFALNDRSSINLGYTQRSCNAPGSSVRAKTGATSPVAMPMSH